MQISPRPRWVLAFTRLMSRGFIFFDLLPFESEEWQKEFRPRRKRIRPASHKTICLVILLDCLCVFHVLSGREKIGKIVVCNTVYAQIDFLCSGNSGWEGFLWINLSKYAKSSPALYTYADLVLPERIQDSLHAVLMTVYYLGYRCVDNQSRDGRRSARLDHKITIYQ